LTVLKNEEEYHMKLKKLSYVAIKGKRSKEQKLVKKMKKKGFIHLDDMDHTIDRETSILHFTRSTYSISGKRDRTNNPIPHPDMEFDSTEEMNVPR
jgi:vacuolar-type H+-ATPase subunit I/STV1